MTDLYGIIIGIGIDGVITSAELVAFHEWMERNHRHKNEKLFNEVFQVLSMILSSNSMTKSEATFILNSIRPFLDTGVNTSETVATQELLGILRGIAADRIISEAEVYGLNAWLVEHESLKENPTAVKIAQAVERILKDGRVDDDEEAELLTLFDKILNPMENDGRLICTGKKFCLSGDFAHGTKSEIESEIISRGGECLSGVTKKCDYVLVGELGSDRYAFGNYGAKVRKAMEMQDAAHPIRIIHEAVLFGSAPMGLRNMSNSSQSFAAPLASQRLQSFHTHQPSLPQPTWPQRTQQHPLPKQIAPQPVSQRPMAPKSNSIYTSPKNYTVALVLVIILGFFGAHRFYAGKPKSAFLMLVTVGGAGIWWIIDIIRVATGRFTDSQGRRIGRK
jgi:TM2 domain-containing membrane protein YozV